LHNGANIYRKHLLALFEEEKKRYILDTSRSTNVSRKRASIPSKILNFLVVKREDILVTRNNERVEGNEREKRIDSMGPEWNVRGQKFWTKLRDT